MTGSEPGVAAALITREVAGKRAGWDSNPRYRCRYAGFQDQSLKPLGHLSGIDAALLSADWKGKHGDQMLVQIGLIATQ